MIPALDFVSRNATFDVHAYDSKYEIALVEIVSEKTKNPYRVLLGFNYKYDYDYEATFPYDNLEEARNMFDELIVGMKIEKELEGDEYHIVVSGMDLNDRNYLVYSREMDFCFFGSKEEDDDFITKYSEDLANDILKELKITKVKVKK